MKTQMIDKSNFDEKQYRADLDCAYECGRASVLSAIENIKAEIEHEGDMYPNGDWYISIDRVREIFDKHISRKEQEK